MGFMPPRPHKHGVLALLTGLLARRGLSMLNLLPERAYEVQMGVGQVARQSLFLVNAPETVREVLAERVGDFPKHHHLVDILQPLIGISLFNANGDEWARQRSLVDQAFSRASLRRSFPLMQQAVQAFLDRTDPCADGRPWQADAQMSFVTADIIFRTIFSKSIDAPLADRVFVAFQAYQAHAQRVMVWSALRLPTGWQRARCRRQAVIIREAFAPMVRARHQAHEEDCEQAPADMLAALMDARHPDTGTRLTCDETVDQVSTLFLAGHETSASTLAWALYLLAAQPALQQRLHEHVCVAWPDNRLLEFDGLRALVELQDLFRETLRLYPPIAFYLREAGCPTALRGKAVLEGDMIALSPWVIQRHLALWERPDECDPSRFRTDSGRQSLKSAYLPFGAGPRACPGAGFASQESLLVLAAMLRRYRIECVEGHEPRPVARLTLRAENGVRLRLFRR